MRHFELNGAYKAEVPGTQSEATIAAVGFRSFAPGWLELRYRHAWRRIDRRGRFLGCGFVGTYAKLRTIVLRHFGAVESLRPGKAEAVHHLLAAGARALAQRTAGRYRLLDDGAHRRIDGAQEEAQVRAAFHFDERRVLVYLLAGVLLLLMVHEIRHDGLIVRDVHAEVNGDGLAAAVMGERIAAAADAVNGGAGVQSDRDR